MKLFQIITADEEFTGRFEVKFSDDVDINEDFDEESSIQQIKIEYCCGESWCETNPSKIDDEIIKDELISNHDKVYWSIKRDDHIIKITDDEVVKDRIYIRKQDREIYESIRKSEGDLKGISNIELFLIAMMLGYNKKGKQGLKGINSSVAVYEEEYMEVLLSNNKMFDIAEKYAIVGIQELEKLYFENEHNFLKRMEKLLMDEFELQGIPEDIVAE